MQIGCDPYLGLGTGEFFGRYAVDLAEKRMSERARIMAEQDIRADRFRKWLDDYKVST